MTNESKHRTISGLPLRQCYEGKDGKVKASDRPGSFPFTRGIHETMYRERLWTMRQYAGFGTARETNRRYHYLLKEGTTGLSVAFDLPTQMGRDADHERAHGEVGRVGVSICALQDMEDLLAGIPLEQVSLSMTINATAAILLAFVLVTAERRGVPWTALRGTIQNDVLKEYIARGTYIYPPRAALRIVTDIFEFCSGQVPQWNTISVSGYHIREAGSTAVDELAFTFADAIAYLDSAAAAGLKIDDIAPRVAFFFNCHIDFLEEVAKFRAARRIWARIVKQRFRSKEPRSQMLRFHTQTAGSSLTAQQPHNNIVRTTIQALAAVLGGTQSLHTNAFDEALGLPTEASARIALRTQQIIAHESGVPGTVDPFGGSYAVEALTTEIEERVMSRIAEIDALGGMVRAIEEQFPQREIERSAYEFQTRVESGERIIVGVNRFAAADEVQPSLHAIDAEGEARQRERLQTLRSGRDAAAWHRAIEALEAAARGEGNLLPPIIDVVRAGGTLGEISDTLREIFGEWRR